MSLTIPDNGLLLEGPTEMAARRPTHAFAVPLSGDLVAQMIEAAQNGGRLQLALNDDPVSWLRLLSPCPQTAQNQMPGPLLLYLPLNSTRVSTQNSGHVQYSIHAQFYCRAAFVLRASSVNSSTFFPPSLLVVNRFTPGDPHRRPGSTSPARSSNRTGGLRALLHQPHQANKRSTSLGTSHVHL